MDGFSQCAGNPRCRLSSGELGQAGEQLAADHLASQGFRILARNWRSRRGEIDIVAASGQTVVFAEVKTRRSLRAGIPLEAITVAKLARIRHLAAEWLAATGTHSEEIRVDVYAIVHEHPTTRLQHIQAVG